MDLVGDVVGWLMVSVGGCVLVLGGFGVLGCGDGGGGCDGC
jgi:hypothetical protein